jgi:hypothetical protein
MTASTAPVIQFTHNDIDIAVRLVDALIAHASVAPATRLSYGALLAQARAMHPRDAALGRAVPLGMGPKLALVARFCRQHGYPDLAALAGAGPHSDAAADPAACAGIDWAAAPAQLAVASEAWRAAVPARLKPRGERPADVAWYAWFRTHRADCAQVSAEGKVEIINLVMAGLDPASALQRVLAAQAAIKA